PDGHRVGGVGDGWRVAITTLSGEREAVGDSQEAPAFELVERLVDTYRNAPGDARRSRPLVTRAWELGRIHELTNRRLVAAAHGSPGPEMSIAKLLHNAVIAACTKAAATHLGPRFSADGGGWGEYAWSRALVSAPGLRIAGGTDEIQRNILGERVLALPKDPAPKQ
ncbi:MAG TPA: acyl-CoA dehydrogenase family protein, partial [Acidimicrobiales bacterium]